MAAQYANSFRLTVRHNVDEVFITFAQARPSDAEDGQSEDIRESLFETVVPKELAQELANKILELLEVAEKQNAENG